MTADDPGDKSDKPEAGEAPAVAHFPAAKRAKACPICGKPVQIASRPFCSKRCADIDLGRWLGEAYRIPAEEPPDGRDQEAPGPLESDSKER